MKMAQEIPTNNEVTPQKAPPKKSGLWSKIIILVVLLVIIGGVIFIVVSVKYPDVLNGNNETAQPTHNQDGEGLSDSAKLLIFILVGGVVIVIGYLIIKGISKGKSGDVPKVPVAPDRAEELFIENFALRFGVECLYDGDKKLYRPANKNAIQLFNKHPYFHTATGDNFLLMEIEVSEGKRQGIHMVIVPIDKGEETIKGGWYRIDNNTPKHIFSLNKNNYPMSSMADKSDRMKLAMLDRIDDPDKASDMMKSMTSSNPNSISTPLDAYGGEGTLPFPSPQRRAPTRRRYTTPKRYYR